MIILAGMPVDLAAHARLKTVGYVPPPGAIQKPCSKCSGPVWLGLRQQLVLQTMRAQVLCFECAIKAGYTELRHLGGEGGQYLIKS